MGMVRGQVTGQGLFTTTLKGKGSVAVMAHGGIIQLPDHPRPPGPRGPAGVRGAPRRRTQQAVHGARLARHGRPRLGRGASSSNCPATAPCSYRPVRRSCDHRTADPGRHDASVQRQRQPVRLLRRPERPVVPAEGQDDRLLRADRLQRRRTRPPGPAGRHAASTRRCTPRTGSSPRAAARCCSPTAPSTSTPTTWTTATSRSAPGNLLAFEPSLSLKQSIIPGFLTLIGTGKFVAASNGAVHFVEPPVRVDPQALVGWADCPSPCHHYDHGYLKGVLGGIRAHDRASAAPPARSTSSSSSARARVLIQSTEVLMAEQATGRGAARGGRPGRRPRRASRLRSSRAARQPAAPVRAMSTSGTDFGTSPG